MKVYICPKSDNKIYHTRICNGLSTHDSIREVELEAINDRRRVCEICDEGPQGPSEQDRSYLDAAEAASPEDINVQ